jgi:hypothetical protein
MKSLLICLLSALSLGGCLPTPDLPRHYKIDDRFTSDEHDRIIAGAERWNRVAREYLGAENALVYDGDFNAPNGFSPDVYNDDLHGIYVGINDQYFQEIQTVKQGDGDNFGHATLEDVTLFTFSIKATNEANLKTDTCHDGSCLNYLDYFERVATHELGHFLGLMLHIMDDATALMAPSAPAKSASDYPFADDIRYLCENRPCIKDPPQD